MFYRHINNLELFSSYKVMFGLPQSPLRALYSSNDLFPYRMMYNFSLESVNSCSSLAELDIRSISAANRRLEIIILPIDILE